MKGDPGRRHAGGQSRTSQFGLKAAERARQALELRMAGITFPEIARALGYADASGAHRAVWRALDRLVREPADELRALQHARIEAAIRAIWPRVLRGDDRAILSLTRLLTREARLMGLDAPTEANVNVTRMIEEMADRAAEMFPELEPEEIVAAAEALLRDDLSR
jgi:hypothetical protein